MDISIQSVDVKGFRCPDGYFDFKNEKISLVQMTNAGGKTTFKELLVHAISGTGERLSAKEIENFGLRNEKGKFLVNEGVFKVVLNAGKEGKVTFEMTFNYENKEVKYSTNDRISRAGKEQGYKPPSMIARFLQPQVVNVFILSADKAESLYKDNAKNQNALDTIKAFSGLDKTEELIDDMLDIYKDFTKEQKGLGITPGTVKAKEKQLENLSDDLEALKSNRDKIKEDFEIAKKDYGDKEKAYKALFKSNKSLQEKLLEQQSKYENAEQDIKEKSKELMNLSLNPFAISENFNKGLIDLNNTLEKLKLPEGATKEFFNELRDETHCVCGTPMCDKMKKHIKDHSHSYLGSDETLVLNQVKAKIKENSIGKPSSKFTEEAKLLNDSIKQRDLASQNIRQLNKQGGDELDSAYKAMNNSEKHRDILKEKLAEYEGTVTPYNTEKMIKNGVFSNIGVLEKEITKLESELARNQKMSSYLNTRDAFIDTIKIIINETIDEIAEEVKNTINQNKLKQMQFDGGIQVTEIKNLIKVRTAGGGDIGSQGQMMGIAYSFCASLLERSSNSFPMVLDHPTANLDLERRFHLANLIPKICKQSISLLLNSETEGYYQGFKESVNNLGTYSWFSPNTQDGQKLVAKFKKKYSLKEIENGVISSDPNLFEEFQFMQLKDFS